MVKAPSPSRNRHRMTHAGTRPPVLGTEVSPPPAPESPFYIMEFAPNFSGAAFPFAENTSRIAKFVFYLIEK
ncbi:hypothetical protein LMG19083_00164 [Ralstonia psammae]|uniref:Uncharacterized protein n=2 Tax=Ralstonia psammae TaxID=3058598 RepID=A0ABM9IYH1_9RALS|nr:hypothetical protein LMG19083_00164 [Ralstonia sp. LMG 19083]